MDLFGSIAGGLIGGLGSLFGGGSQTDALEEANRIMEEASKRAFRFQKRVYEQNREDLRPWREVGQETIATLAEMQKRGDFDPGQFRFTEADFKADPGYRFRRDEGQKGIERTAAARGNLLSGAQIKAASTYNQNVASNEYGNAFNRALTTWQADAARRGQDFNRLSSLAGTGQNAANFTAQLGQNYANAGQQNILGTAQGIAQNTVGIGQVNASMYGNLAAGANQGIENYLLWNKVG